MRVVEAGKVLDGAKASWDYLNPSKLLSLDLTTRGAQRQGGSFLEVLQPSLGRLCPIPRRGARLAAVTA